MESKEFDRKVSIIVALDVVGYSKLVEKNENQTLLNLKKFRSILDAGIERFGGRIFNTGGDSVLAEFASAVQAIECVVEFQKKVHQVSQNSSLRERMLFRVGINVGDVIHDKGNLLGDGVNIAARLEALCQPGEVCISKAIFDLVSAKIDLDCHDLGEQTVKDNSFHALDIIVNGSRRSKFFPFSKKKFRTGSGLVAGLLVLLLLGIGIFKYESFYFTKADISKFAYQLPTKPSLVVLPFNNLSGDPNKDYICEGISQNISLQISTSSEVFVISNSSAKEVVQFDFNSAEIAESLGIRYLLTGSVQEMDGSLRVNVELVDAIEGHIVWVDKFSGKTSDLFQFQDQITENVFKALQINFMSNLGGGSDHTLRYASVHEMRLFAESRRHLLKWTPDGHRKMEMTVDQIYSGPESSGPAHLARGWMFFQKVMMNPPEQRQELMMEGRKMAARAHSLMHDPNSLVLSAWFDLYDRNYRAAQEKISNAMAIGEPSGDVLAVAGTVFLLSMKPQEAKKFLAEAMRISPFHPAWYANRYVTSLIMLNEYDEAKAMAGSIYEKAQSGDIFVLEGSRALVSLAVMAKREGNNDFAQESVNLIKKLQPEYNQKSLDKQLGMLKDKELLLEYKQILGEFGLPTGDK